ncbi:putative indole-3-acetic acid-amido synthetase GH3.1 [Silene latifolia]|uniref:putative indole-3-acetic acid-amido synthetase GH3.1 n=1 Tax=Silene latifolia TaxID=37657 RepID=UPI003D76E8D3
MNPTDTGVENATIDHAQDAYEASFRFIDELTSKCDDVQANVLAEILSQNLETEYLKRYDLSKGCMDREKFKSKVPVITYDDIKHDIGRIYNGDMSPILTTQPISEIWLSSGTSDGQRKPVLATDDDMQRRHMLITTIMPFIRHRINGQERDNGKAFSLLLTRNEIVTPGGLLARPSLSSVYKNPKFYCDKHYPFNTNTSLIEAIHCSDHFQSIYTQLLCGFYQRLEVTRIKVVYGSTLVWAVHFLKKYYSELCHDISSGCLSSKMPINHYEHVWLRRLRFMHDPKPELAKFIEHTCMEENWEQIFKKIWPNTKYLETVVSGSMAQYIPILNYYSGGLDSKFSSNVVWQWRTFLGRFIGLLGLMSPLGRLRFGS